MAYFDPINTNDYKDANNMDLIPNGIYKMQVKEAEVCTSKNGSGQYIKMTWEIVEGTYAKRIIFQNINIRNTSANAEKIGRGQLARVLTSMGITVCNNTDQLLYKPVMGKIGVEVDKTGQYEDRNKVISTSPYSSNDVVVPNNVETEPSTPSMAKKAPWL